MITTEQAPAKNTLTIAIGSLFISFLVLGIKFLAYKTTGSLALYSDALESIINLATALAAILAIRIAAQPADAEHPYGHHKAEYISAIGVGALIIIAALAILKEAYTGFINPQPIQTPWLGMAISTAATALNLGWSLYLIRQGKKLRSAALHSDGKHLMADVVTSIGVVIGLLLVVLTGMVILDAAIAALVALHVLFSGWEVIRTNASGLLDEAVSEDELKLIHSVIDNHPNVIEIHDLRTRHAGKATFIEFHLVVPGTMTVTQSHTICDTMESDLRQAIPGAFITIHVEPEHKAKLHSKTLAAKT